jgi:hypothetical protein
MAPIVFKEVALVVTHMVMPEPENALMHWRMKAEIPL